MCIGGSSKYQKRAAEAQTKALEAMAAANKAKTAEMVSKTNQTVKTNKDAKKREMQTLRIPLNARGQQTVGNGINDTYGLNIPL